MFGLQVEMDCVRSQGYDELNNALELNVLDESNKIHQYSPILLGDLIEQVLVVKFALVPSA
ncbi:MAG: hypothetical protein SAK29_16790 [Scytonema sp. PMC 1069.18]|nr:hypothetical protein [Scytonema sp. PMC 1069.18]MEC4879759.1 hypothetical protein [Scytonema sp. PMC 1070.18]